MSLCRFARVMRRVQCMGMGAVGVVSCYLMMTGAMVSGGFLMMLGCMLVVLGSLHMVGRMGSHCLSFLDYESRPVFGSGRPRAIC
jgi:hypothetical protein